MALQIFLCIITISIALVTGLQLRRLFVRRLHTSILDAWLTQTLGIVIILLPLLVIIPVILALLEINLFYPLVSWVSTNTDTVRDFSINLTLTVLILALGIGIARTIRVVTLRSLETNRIDINIRTLIARIFFILALVITGFFVLSLWKIQLILPVALVGAITVALTVSMQDVIKDLVAGFYILIERPFFIGNIISTATHTGRVEDIQLRATRLRMLTGEEVMIPNWLIFTGTVVNNSYYAERRATIDVTLPEELFVHEQTPASILSTLNEIDGVMPKPEPSVLFSSYAEEKVTLTVRFWVASEQPSAISDVMYTLHKLLPRAQLSVKEFAGNV